MYVYSEFNLEIFTDFLLAICQCLTSEIYGFYVSFVQEESELEKQNWISSHFHENVASQVL